ncbi:hypothetical protein MUCCIDRAFT_76938 [Mucor lusitanicus CBS 277.49]|uniref:Uncharacterized protein n=1 Tax=Mucor lusitanicus CBS 277.49 TaxID=747725 RepID=A0A168PS91_MUCCL|nr:hypothetical protein MUCCIDRAFT_76938 [Mucor lusitanicus CBS 277.49]
MDVVLSAADMTEDIVEDFARQLDEEVDAVQEQQSQTNDSDQDDDDDDRMFGYQQLPQDDNDDDEHMYGQLASDDDDEDENQGDIKDPLQIDVAEADQLQPETSDLIKSIMSNIKLSEDAIPEWAKKIPEEAWLPRTAIEKN